MKRFFILIILFFAVPAWAAKKITVGQLEDLLRSLQQDKKSDADVANTLKQVELTEELTRSRMNTLAASVPGPLSTEQIYVLEARSADLAPPPSDLPATPPPDAAADKAIQAKAAAYITQTFARLPSVTATRTTLRFQDNVEAVSSSSGLSSGAKDVVTSASFSNPASFVHYINSSERAVLSEHGAEKPPSEKDKTPWGANRMIAIQQPDPSLTEVLKEVEASGSLHWLRWELVNGKTAAVYAFTVPRERSRMDLRVCCFPNVNQAGVANFYTATTASTLGGGGSGGGVTGNFQTNTEWHEFRATVPYHGELFVDPATGIVVRLITEAELKPNDVVHKLDTRIDYAPVTVGQSTMILPVKTVLNSVVVPNGDSGAGGYSTRCTLFTSEFKDYRAVSK